MTVPILYAGNRAMFDGIVISLLSVTKYRRDPLDVYLLTMDLRDLDPRFAPIDETQRVYLETLCREANAQSRVTLLEAGQMYRETLLHSPNEATSYTPYCFLRLYADRFPQLPDKIIYLDTDTVLCGDIAELYLVELSDCEYAAVRDHYGCHFFGINYINSGVMLLQLNRIRQTLLFRRALDACAEKKIFLPDQTALNRLVRRRKILPRRFNEQKKDRSDTLIRHFSMNILWLPWFHTRNIKPWDVERVHNELHTHRYDAVLDEYLSRRANVPELFRP